MTEFEAGDELVVIGNSEDKCEGLKHYFAIGVRVEVINCDDISAHCHEVNANLFQHVATKHLSKPNYPATKRVLKELENVSSNM